MNISRQSWHYRFMKKHGSSELKYDFMNGRRTFTTCTYIQALIGVMFSVLVFICAVLFVGSFAIGTTVSMVYTAFVFFDGGLPPEPTIPLLAGFIGWMFTIMLGSLALIYAFIQWAQSAISKKSSAIRNKKRLKKKEEPSVFAKALKDRKDGICTIVTFN